MTVDAMSSQPAHTRLGDASDLVRDRGGEARDRAKSLVTGCVGLRAYALEPDPILIKRMLDRIEVDDAKCWLWTGALSGNGYPRISIDGRLYMTHRVMYVMVRGPIHPALDLDHLCRVRICINPHHLEPVTRAINLQRGFAERTKASA